MRRLRQDYYTMPKHLLWLHKIGKGGVRQEIAQPLFIMGIEYGLGMLLMGIVALIIGGTIAFKVINKVMENDDDK